MGRKRCLAHVHKNFAFRSALEVVKLVWLSGGEEDRTGAEEPDEEGRTGLVKYVSATAALRNNVYKHGPEKLPSPPL